MRRLGRLLGGCLLLLTLGPVALFGWMGAFAGWYEARLWKQVTGPAPDDFPFLVITTEDVGQSARAHVVFARDLSAFLEAHPRHAFLVPAEEEGRVRKQIKDNPDVTGKGYWSADLEVRRLGDARQILTLRADTHFNYARAGEYEARPGGVVPMRFKYYFGPGLAMSAFWPGVGATAATWVAAAVLYFGIRHVRRRRRQNAATGGA